MGGKDTKSKTTVESQYDPETSAAMVEIGQAQQAMSEEMWDYYKTIFQPYEQAMVESNLELLPYATAASKATLQEIMRDIREGRPVKDALRKAQLEELEWSGPVAEEFYRQALEGVDPEARMGEATANVQQAFSGAESQIGRHLGRMGVRPGSGRSAENVRQMAIEKAKVISGARTGAARQAELESFGRLQAAMGARGRATGLPGTQAMGGLPQTQFGNYGLQNPAQMAGGFASGASSSYGAIAGRPLSQTTTSTMTQPSGFWPAVGQIGGTVGGLWASKKFLG